MAMLIAGRSKLEYLLWDAIADNASHKPFRELVPGA